MIDIHCHILPGIDDGPESLDEALEICRSLSADGVDTIVATPHFRPGMYEWTGPVVSDAAARLQSAVYKAGLSLRILPGAEVSVFPELPSLLKPGGYLTINGGPYFLIEFSPYTVPANWVAFLISFLENGLIPVIAHPERNAWFMGHISDLALAVRSGVMVQVTAESLTGGLGQQARDASAHLLRRNLAHVIASDAHGPDLRLGKLSEAVGLAAELIGRERAASMVTTVPEAIISGRKIDVPEPLDQARTGRMSGPGNTLRRWCERYLS